MSLAPRRLGAETLQWYGLFGAALVWTAQLIVGFGATVARCSAAGAGWGIGLHTWEIVLTAAAAALALTAEIAAVTILVRTRGVDHSAEAPLGRRRFFAVAAALANVLFLCAILMSGLGVLTHAACRQA